MHYFHPSHSAKYMKMWKDAVVTGVIKSKLWIYKEGVNCMLELRKSNVNVASMCTDVNQNVFKEG